MQNAPQVLCYGHAKVGKMRLQGAGVELEE